jgi:uncharacterized membrane protein YqjE
VAKRVLYCSVALFVLGCIYAITVRTPIYRLDWLSILIVILVAVGVLANVWKLED